MQDIKPIKGTTDIFFDLYFYYDEEKQKDGFKNPNARHDRRVKSTEYKGLKEINGKKWHTYKIEQGSCQDTQLFNKECNHPIVASENGRTVCEGCGIVSGPVKLIPDYDLLVQRGVIHDEDPETVCYDEPKKELSKAGEYIKKLMNNSSYYNNITKKQPALTNDGRIKYIDNSKEEWRAAQKAMDVDIVCSNFMYYSKQQVKEFIDTHSLKTVHSRLNTKAVITGICIYFMEKDGRELIIEENDFCKEVGLTGLGYLVIKRNLDRLNI